MADFGNNATPQYLQDYTLPESVRSFVTYFHRFFTSKNVYEIRNYYQIEFPKISEREFRDRPWPPVHVIAPVVGEDAKFLALYQELCFRHIYGRLKPTLYNRFDSWQVYCNLFELFLADGPAGMEGIELPEEWLYDIVGEYIYQFQEFCKFRSMLATKGDEEIALLADNRAIWDTTTVIRTLVRVVQKSGIEELLSARRSAQKARTVPTQKILGYFGLVGIVRVQLLLGDYHSAMRVLDSMDLDRQGQFTRVNVCYVTTHYYMGFALLLMRQYARAIAVFSKMLTFIMRTQLHRQARTPHVDLISKKHDQMVVLLAMAVTLCPGQRLDERVRQLLYSKCEGQMAEMRSATDSSLSVYESLFSFGCPKFVLAACPDYQRRENYDQEAFHQQLSVFMQDVSMQLELPSIRSFLKLYRSIPLSKLASFANPGKPNPTALRRSLTCLKHKTRSGAAATSSSSTGRAKGGVYSDVHFWMDNDMVHIDEERKTRHFGEFFIGHLERFELVINDVERDIVRQQ